MDSTVSVVSGAQGQQLTVSAADGKVLGVGAYQPTMSVRDAVSGPIVTYSVAGNKLKASLQAAHSSSSAWTFTPLPGYRIVTVTSRPSFDPVASIGKVLGDRSVLYKYLNPNLVFVATVNEAGNTASIHLLDSVSGATVYATTQSNVDATYPIAATVSENWFAYSLTVHSDITTPTSSKGYQLVVTELLESRLPDDRGILGSNDNYSSIQPSPVQGSSPYVLSQTYHIPEPISNLSVSQTKQGITSKHLLAVLPETNSLIGIPRTVLDPRRPIGREANKDEQLEGLFKYTPNLEFHPQWYLNHKREVFGLKNILSVPAAVESTSLVFAYGLDVFGTRIAPSGTFDVLGKEFNKIQMSATVLALAVGVVVVAPLVNNSVDSSVDPFSTDMLPGAKETNQWTLAIRLDSDLEMIPNLFLPSASMAKVFLCPHPNLGRRSM